jgi:hypothetical protein
LRLRIAGITAIVLGVAIVALFGEFTSVECTRADDNRVTCSVERVGLLSAESRRFEQISRAEVRCTYTTEDAPCTDTLILYRDGERIDAISDTFTIDEQIIIADTINNLVANAAAAETSAYFPELRVLALRLVPAVVLLVVGAVLLLRGRE